MALRSILLAFAGSAALADELKVVDYSTPARSSSAYLFETFDAGLPDTFIKTSGNKQDSDASKYSGTIEVEAAQKNALGGDLGLVLKDKAKHHAIATDLKKPFVFTDEDTFVIQYEVNFQTGIECGGAYVKLLADDESLDLKSFDDKTRFTFMFGPDKCSSDYKLHFIYNYQNPKTGEFEEKHLKTKPATDVLKKAYGDASPHLYKLVLKSDNSFSITLDETTVSSGNLLEDLSPSVNPEKEIVDKDDKKPEDWDDREKIDDPTAVKPDDWDESAPTKIVDEDAVMPKDWREDLEPLIDDPEAIIPEDWDEDMDGEYTPPQVDNADCKDISGCGVWEKPMKNNPAFKGKWAAKKIKNPDYQGIWKARMIPNPDYYEDATPFASASSIKSLAIEVWTMSSDIMFDNIYLGTDENDADALASSTFLLKKQQAKLNEPTIIEKAKKAADENKWIMYVVSALVGIPVLYLIYSKTRKTPEPEVPEAAKEVDSEPEEENEASDEQGAGDNASDDREEDDDDGGESSETSEQGAGDDASEEASDNDEPVKNDAGLRKRSSRRKAD